MCMALERFKINVTRQSTGCPQTVLRKSSDSIRHLSGSCQAIFRQYFKFRSLVNWMAFQSCCDYNFFSHVFFSHIFFYFFLGWGPFGCKEASKIWSSKHPVKRSSSSHFFTIPEPTNLRIFSRSHFFVFLQGKSCLLRSKIPI